MKPDEEMHSSVEEVDLDPCDLYIDLGTLIVEGRVPGLTERGFGEGPHCHPLQGQNRHQCNPGSLECQKYEQIQKHMLLLWKNGIPMSIEVLLYPSCCAGSTTIPSVDTASVPEMSYILLEQWTVHMLPRRVPDASINPRGLIQAVRSFLYFSQLCAWLSLTGGKSPQNIHYRICVPGEAFSSKFIVQPDVHIFPVSNIGRSTAMKVMVKSHPRCGQIPVVLCDKHTQLSQPVKTTKQVFRTEKLEDLPEESSSCDSGAEGEYVCDGVVPTALMAQKTSRTNSPADSMLGESLLDPPNSLCMYPKRYQSPSRCGSPSLEVPEHLMFGKGSTVKREAEMQRLKQETRNRSRPQRRPVVERFLKKTLGDEVGASGSTEKNCHSLDKRHSPLSDLLKPVNDTSAVGHDGLVNYLYMSDDLKTLPKAEMERVLHRLRNRCPRAKNTCDDSQCTYLLNNNEAVNCKLPKKSHLHDVSDYLQDLKINVNKLPYKQKHLPQELCKPNKSTHSASISESPLHLGNHSSTDKELVIQINQQSKPLGKNYNYPTKDVHDSQYSYDRTSEYFLKHQMSDRTEHTEFHDVQNAHTYQWGQDNQNDLHVKKDTLFPCAIQENHSDKLGNDYCLASDSNRTQHTYQDCKAEKDENDTSTNSSGNNKKNYSLPHSRTWTEGLTEGQTMPNVFQGSTLLRYLFKPAYVGFSEGEVDVANAGHIIPSAEEKAQFRRSLDSATSLVFHQKTGLPLTSSPAPIRKSGTCFDFDSSLTTVSAIKRALFEKEPDDGEWDQERTLHISTSAPASITVSSLLGTFEESVLNGRLEPVSTVEGFTAEIGASGSFCPRHITLPVTVFFYTLQDTDKVTSPYLGHINLGKREYYVPKKGTVQVTLFNPHNTVVKMYVVRYDLSDMPSNCQTFLRQRTLYMPTDASENDPEAQKWLRYLIHLRFASTKSGRIYLHTDVRVIVFRKSDLDAATVHGQRPYELRSFTHGPNNPKFSPHK